MLAASCTSDSSLLGCKYTPGAPGKKGGKLGTAPVAFFLRLSPFSPRWKKVFALAACGAKKDGLEKKGAQPSSFPDRFAPIMGGGDNGVGKPIDQNG